MTTPRLYKISRWVVCIAAAIVLLWDLFAQLVGGSGATVSMAIWRFAGEVPFVTFLVGFVNGHLFWGDPAKFKGPTGLQPKEPWQCPTCGNMVNP